MIGHGTCKVHFRLIEQLQQDINLYWISIERGGLPETQAKYVHDKQEALKFDLKIYIYEN